MIPPGFGGSGLAGGSYDTGVINQTLLLSGTCFLKQIYVGAVALNSKILRCKVGTGDKEIILCCSGRGELEALLNGNILTRRLLIEAVVDTEVVRKA